MKAYLHLFWISFFFLTSIVQGQILPAGNGFFDYTGYAPLRAKPVRVYYHIPVGDRTNMPILIVFHGEDRDGLSSAQEWYSASDQNRFMVFAPVFSDANYGGGDGYNLGNMFVDGDNPTSSTRIPDSLWTFSLVDPLFNFIKVRAGTTVPSYVAFGHSAGAQFLHRFVEYIPQSLASKVICANAGWYTVPDPSVVFPYGARVSVWSTIQAQDAFQKKLLVLLGQLDTNPNSAGLRHNAQADAQGLYRLARGRYFYAQSRSQAIALNSVYNWGLAEVPGVGHNSAQMATNAIPYVLDAFTPMQPKIPTTYPRITLKGNTIDLSDFDTNETYKLSVYTPIGTKIFEYQGVYVGPSSISFEKGAHSLLIVTVQGKNRAFISRRMFSY